MLLTALLGTHRIAPTPAKSEVWALPIGLLLMTCVSLKMCEKLCKVGTAKTVFPTTVLDDGPYVRQKKIIEVVPLSCRNGYD